MRLLAAPDSAPQLRRFLRRSRSAQPLPWQSARESFGGSASSQYPRSCPTSRKRRVTGTVPPAPSAGWTEARETSEATSSAPPRAVKKISRTLTGKFKKGFCSWLITNLSHTLRLHPLPQRGLFTRDTRLALRPCGRYCAELSQTKKTPQSMNWQRAIELPNLVAAAPNHPIEPSGSSEESTRNC
jgi:hypothetical protein